MIELKNIYKTYNRGMQNEVRALRGVDLSVGDGESLAVMGVSGSGKSTLLHIIGCLDTPTQGEYRLNGKDICRLGNTELSRIRNKNIGFVLQDYGLVMNDSVFNNVVVPLIFNKQVKASQREGLVMNVLEAMGISAYRKTKVGRLSGGQRQRVAIARAIVNDPDVILADEPTAALDSATANEIMGVLQELNDRGKTIILVTHDAGMAGKMRRIVRIADGVISKN